MEEIWKEIHGFESFYEASSLGRVRSLRYHGTTRKVPRIIVGAVRNGYRQILLYNFDQKRFTKKSHVAVLEAFVGPRPTKYHGAHLNGDRSDNRVENLAWVTCKENMRHRDLHGTTMRGIRHHDAKVDPPKVREIRAIFATGEMGYARLGRVFGMGESSIKKIVNRVTWKHVE